MYYKTQKHSLLLWKSYLLLQCVKEMLTMTCAYVAFKMLANFDIDLRNETIV